jgi:perosamine synthetase
MVTIITDRAYGFTHQSMMSYFDALEIETRPFFHPLSALPAFASAPDAVAARERNVHSYDLSPRGLNLPSALMLEEGQVDRVCTAVRQLLARK